MPKWSQEDIRKMKYALENCFMLANRKRSVTYTYPAGGLDPVPNGPRSDDADWDHIVRFCKDAGLSESVIRLMGETT